MGCVILAVALIPPIHPQRFREAGLTALVIAGISILILVLARKFWPVYVGPDGVRSYTAFGTFLDVPWEEMKQVTKSMGYYWITTSKGQMISVPTWLEKQMEFNQYVMTHAPATCPLRQHLTPKYY